MATAGCFARIWWELAQLIGGGARATRYLWVAVAVLGLAGRQLRPRRPGVAGRRREDVVACLRASLEDLLRSPLSCAVGGGLGDAELCFCEAVAVDVCVSGQICAGVGARRHGRLGVAGALAAARKTTRWCDCGGALAVRSQLLLPARASVWSGMGRSGALTVAGSAAVSGAFCRGGLLRALGRVVGGPLAKAMPACGRTAVTPAGATPTLLRVPSLVLSPPCGNPRLGLLGVSRWCSSNVRALRVGASADDSRSSEETLLGWYQAGGDDLFLLLEGAAQKT
ncbi:hypothetical protein ZEAMMB73_Zm00001d048961 [Zea mays]|uniref:Uncharacterized protein n=1 Tax=Zea mays TaxID=4577 RepID=K7U9H3_MAIZE|nr:hypothetical protein ZEAMMB73_Zm00001d048961 [Zea mays]